MCVALRTGCWFLRSTQHGPTGRFRCSFVFMYLQSLHSIHGVTITSGTGTTVCLVGAQSTLQITFSQDFGDVPALIVEEPALFSATVAVCASWRQIYEGWCCCMIGALCLQTTPTIVADGTSGSQAGTMENAVCSNRGICDERRGECQCFLQWGSSGLCPCQTATVCYKFLSL